MLPLRNGFTTGDRSRMKSPLATPPTPDDQREAVADAMKIEMRQGQAWYVLCNKWWQLWKAHVRYDSVLNNTLGVGSVSNGEEGETDSSAASGPSATKSNAKSESHAVRNASNIVGAGTSTGANDSGAAAMAMSQESHGTGPGPIDNRTLGDGRELREGMMEGDDYVLLNNRAYELLEGWCGGGPRFKRWVISLGNGNHSELIVELFPVKFMVYTCLPNGQPDPASERMQFYSRTKTMRQICADVKSSLNLTPKVDTRLSLKKPEDQDTEAETDAETGESTSEANTVNGTAEDGWQEIHLEEVSQSLDEVMGDTQRVALLVETRDSSNPDDKSFPRDPIIMRWRFNLKVGDLIDSRDTDKKWFEGRVVEVDTHGNPDMITVHFLGWSDKWNQIFDRSSEDIQKLHTFTARWRQELRVNSKVDLCGSPQGARRWYSGKVDKFKFEEGRRKLLVSVDSHHTTVPPRWVDEDGEEICEVGTHVTVQSDRGSNSNIPRQRLGSGVGLTTASHLRNNRGAPKAPGSVGLRNLGNTCFMNSMLQCLLATESLSTYFRNLAWKSEVNHDNPLGMKGKVAEAYASLNDDAWSGEFSVVSPNNLKQVVAQYAPMFGGYQQHDASELMSFLLDGIHEDLNRVHKKRYVETVDSAGREDAVVAEESWRCYITRNDSIMVDTCTGLLRSHVTCPVCTHSSVTFDPYTSLSLPLPVENAYMVKLLFQPLPYGSRPLMMAFTLAKDNFVGDLKTQICERVNASRAGDPAASVGSAGMSKRRHAILREDCLAVIETWSSRVYRTIDDTTPITDMKDSDFHVVSELEYPNGIYRDEDVSSRYLSSSSAGVNGCGAAADESSSLTANSMDVESSPSSMAAGGSGGGGSAQAAGDAGGEEGHASRAERSGVVNGAGEAAGDSATGGSCSLLVDIILATGASGASAALTGGPRRVTCREGVTNLELHDIVRRHVSRFVPSLKSADLAQSNGGSEGEAFTVAENEGAGAMMVDEDTQEPGITGTGDIASDYVHVTPEDGKEEVVAAAAAASGASQGATPGAGSGTSETRSSSRPAAVAAASPPTVVSSRPDAPSPDSSSFVHVKKPVIRNGDAAGTGGGDESVSDGSAKGTDAVDDDAEEAVVVVRADAEEVVATDEVVEGGEEVWNDVTTNTSCGSESAGDGGGGGSGGNGPISSVAATASGGAGAGNGAVRKSQHQNSQPQSQVLLVTNGEGGAGSCGSGRNVGGGAVAGARKVKNDRKAGAGEPWGKGIGAGVGGSAATMLPYQVMVTDFSGNVMKGYNHEVPLDNAPFQPPDLGRRMVVTIKVVCRPESVRVPGLVDADELDAFDEDESVTEAKMARERRQSIPLTKCFEKYTEGEQLGQSELWYCSKCKTHRQAHKKLDVYTAPDVLIIVLKRFLVNPGNPLVSRQKLDTHVTFPLSGLDLTGYIRSVGGPIFEKAPPVYDLYAVSEHSGSLRGGHYTAIAQNSDNRQWYSFNDTHVSEINPDREPSSLPYVLFYKRRKGLLRWAGMCHENTG